MKTDLKDCMIDLGWKKYDGGIWSKNDLKMDFNQAVIWELQYWNNFQRKVVFECPDCGYTPTFKELDNSLRYK